MIWKASKVVMGLAAIAVVVGGAIPYRIASSKGAATLTVHAFSQSPTSLLTKSSVAQAASNNSFIVIPPQVDEAGKFSDGLAAVKIGDKWGYIDKSGDRVISPQFDEAKPFSKGFAAVKIGSQWGYINKNGDRIISPQFDEADNFFDGLARVKINGKYGYIDNSGKLVIAAEFDEAEQPWHFAEGLARVKIGDKWGYVRKPLN